MTEGELDGRMIQHPNVNHGTRAKRVSPQAIVGGPMMAIKVVMVTPMLLRSPKVIEAATYMEANKSFAAASPLTSW